MKQEQRERIKLTQIIKYIQIYSNRFLQKYFFYFKRFKNKL